ncbi:MAG: iron ABC transporter substrate-binding protein [Candidatus Promineifilaceae bacterium]
MLLTPKWLACLMGLVLLAALAACQPEEVAPTENTPPAPVETEPAAQIGEGELVIYSGRSESLVQPIIDQFAAATGIDVQVRYGSTPELAGVLLEEGDRSPADLFYAQDPGGLGAVAAAGLFAPLPETTLSAVPARFAAETGEWVGISGRARVVVYNTDLITDPAAQLPADIFDFIDPAWRGQIGWAPTNASFQAMVTAMRAVWGEEKTQTWLAGIQANEPIVYSGNSPVVAAVGAGEVTVGFVNHYYLYRFLSEQGEGFAARNYFLPGGGPGSLIMVSGVGILRTAPNAENAQRFIDFMLSLPAQQYFATQTYEYPVVAGVATPSSLPPLEELEAVALDIPLADLTDLEGTQQMLLDLGIIE